MDESKIVLIDCTAIAQKVLNIVDQMSLHSHPTRRRVSQIVKADIKDSLLPAESAKGNALTPIPPRLPIHASKGSTRLDLGGKRAFARMHISNLIQRLTLREGRTI